MTESQIAAAPDSALVRAAQGGSVAALDELITGHLPLVYSIVGRALNGHPDVDDLVQDTMLQAIRSLHSLREPDRFRSWLITIAYRRVQMHLRSRKVSLARRHPEPVDVPDPSGDFAERTTAELVVAEQRRELAEAGRWLEEGDRELLALWWQEACGGLSRAELAAALAVQPKHAAVRVQRMKAQLDLARGVVRALHARPICPELGATIRSWDGTADSLWRKRLGRHVRGCPRCHHHLTGLVSPERLLAGAALLPVPVAVTAAVQAAVHGGAAGSAPAAMSLAGHFATLVQHKALAAATVATVAAGGLAYAVLHQPATPETTIAVAPPPVTTPPAAPARPSATSDRSASAASAAPATTASPSAPARPGGPGVTRADVYVAPGGDDGGDGSIDRPYATIAKAVSVARPGWTIALRGGIHRPTSPIAITTSGTAAQPVTLSGYGSEKPVIDASAIPADKWSITQEASYWTVRDLEITGSRSQAYVCRSCTGTVFQRLVVHGSASSGLMLRDSGTAGNQVLDSDFYNNGGSGLAVQFGDGDGNRLRGNRAFRNGGDGVNLGAFDSAVTVEYTWSFGNGANGFAVGGGTPASTGAHRVRHSAAWDNDGHGFVDEGSTGAIDLTNNTAFRNTGLGFAMTIAPAVLRRNVATGNEQGEVSLSAGAKADNNTWQRSGWSETDLRSTDASGAGGPRTASGGLPRTTYLATNDGTGASMSGG
ncbi:sigma-70 family RNA polymerase sigma factor [Actinoplanes sp. DH11]|uniref:sigma-70 family RNA polymerase sigma factor n=1 Tax=Actinoplanes sp. DH11 TaxID=2857011 RepID=UPI001E3DB624|nr:sigma-70 family RNA polymerase sigma factor [Actinoplanes sp. DH11]